MYMYMTQQKEQKQWKDGWKDTPMKIVRLMFFVDRSEEEFFQGVQPLGFKRIRQELVFRGTAPVKITPFSNNGGHKSGYRLTYTGEYLHDLMAVMSLLFNAYQAYITGVETVIENLEQSRCILLAEKAGYTKGSAHGSYSHQQIGVVCLPFEQVVLLYRKRGMTRGMVEKVLRTMDDMATYLQEKEYNLFHLHAEEQRVQML